MLIERIRKAADPSLAGRTVRDVVIGLSLVAVCLDDGQIGVSYVLRENLPAGCSAFPYGTEVPGAGAPAVADWAVRGEDVLSRSIGTAVLCAGAGAGSLSEAETPERPFGLTVGPGDTVGLVGYIAGVVRAMENRAGTLHVFDRGLAETGEERAHLRAMGEQDRLLPACDVVFLSGTTLLNGTLEALLARCQKAREVVLIGASTPLWPEAFSGSGVTVLAGTRWEPGSQEELFRRVSLAGGILALRPFSRKISVRTGPV